MDSNEYTVTNADLTVLRERHPEIDRELMIIVQQRIIKEKDAQISALSKTVALNNGNIDESIIQKVEAK